MSPAKGVAMSTFDTVVRGGRWFDGSGAPSAIRDIGIRDGRVAAISTEPLDTEGARVIDAEGAWVTPGLIDIHTHYDVEVLDTPELTESLRHGVTTVFIGSCSLSTIYVNGEEAGDLFGRVEAIPRDHVISAVDEHKDWSSPREYVERLEGLPLGANLAAFIGHSDMRTSVMGLDRATRSDVRPTHAEQARMEEMLGDALVEGFVGLSSQQLKFDKLDGVTCRSRTLPSTYAKPKELRRLKSMLRHSGRVLQSGPDIQNPLNLVSQMVQSIGFGRPVLKTSLLSAADVKSNEKALILMDRPTALINRLGGDFRWQHLPVPFEVYADGIDLVIFEEFGSGAAALHLRDDIERDALIQDEEYRRRFRKDYEQKFGIRVWHRDFFDADIVACPDESVIGKSFGQVGLDRGGLHPVDAFLDLVVEHGREIRWRTTISNHRPEMLKKIATWPTVQMGFSDAGAHLRNMAFYNSGLRLLRHVRDAEQAGKPFMSTEYAIHRLTGEVADFYDIDAGHLRVGDRADLVVIDPEHLDEQLEAYGEAPIEQFGQMSRMVNRNDAAIRAVMVSGQTVFADGEFAPSVGTVRTGSFLRAGHTTPPTIVPPATAERELIRTS